MTHTKTSDKRSRGGTAYVLSLMAMIVFSVLAAAMASNTMLIIRAGDNHRSAVNARLAAESGMDFILNQIRSIRLPADTSEETMSTNLGEILGSLLNATANLQSQTVTVSREHGENCQHWTAHVPDIQLPYGNFSCTLVPDGPDSCTLVVRGSANAISRSITIDLVLIPRHSTVFDYGLASFGPVSMSGNAKIVGVNDPSEANMMAATTSGGTALSLGGNAVIGGQLTVVDNAPIAISGTPSLGGTSDPEQMAQYIHSVPSAPEVPTLDVAPLAALAINVVDSSTHTSTSGMTFSNIRIAAGANPTFASDVVINGIIYVEAPNIVTFSGKATINGIVATEASNNPIESCQLHFAGQVEAFAVETLPETPEFSEIRQHTGTFVLAPGFAVTFSGQFSAINGTIAADKLTFTGQSEGIVNGAVIGLGNYPTALDGNVEIHVDRQGAYPNPAGFVKNFALEAKPASYTELVGG